MLTRAGKVSLAILAGLAGGCGGSEVELVGTVERTNLELTAPISEKVVEIPVRVGQRVEADEVVVRLDSEVSELELRAAEARFSAAEAGQSATQRELERIEGLRRARVSSLQQLDDARRAAEEAVALSAVREAGVAQTRKRLEDLTIAPSRAGVVDQIPYDIGERVPAGGVVAVVLADEAPWVRVWMPARAVARVRAGDAATVEVQGLERTLTGRIEDIAREPEFTPHYALTEREREHLVYRARVMLEDAPQELRPGLAATVVVPLRSTDQDGGGQD